MFEQPVLLVFRAGAPPALLDALDALRVSVRECAASEAAELVRGGGAQLVVCDRVPGWQALVARVEDAGGGALLFGPPPTAAETTSTLPQGVEAVEDPEQVVSSLARAFARVHARRDADATEESLLERVQNAERVSRFAQSIATQIDLPQVVAEAMARTRDLCDADGAALLLVDPNTGELCFDAVSGGAGDAIQTVRLQPGEGVAGRVAVSATPMLVRDAQASPLVSRTSDEQSGYQTGSIVAVPLLLGGDVVGVLEAVRAVGRRAFEERHLKRLQGLAPHVTLAVHNARMTAQLRETQLQVLRANTELEDKVRQRTLQISQAKREWEATFDAISEPIALMEGFVVKRANTAYAQRVGLPITQLPGKTCHQLLAGRDTPCPGCPLAAGAPQGTRAEIRLPDGTVFAFNAFTMGQGRVVANYRDVTQEKRLEGKLRESEKLASLGQLASGAAHEINNPLGFVISNLRSLDTLLADLGELAGAVEAAAGLARAGKGPDAARALLEVDLEEARALLDDGRAMVKESLSGGGRVADIVRGLRELSRLQIDRSEPTLVDGSITRAVRAELGSLPAGTAVLELAARQRVLISPLHLDQALGHVLKNARQALAPGQKVHVRTRDEEASVLVEVQDEGCGIKDEHVSRVFEPFFTTRGVGGGVGLGLTAAYGIVQRNGGTIEVQSAEGRGTTVRIRLPRAEPLEDASPAALAASA